MSNKIDIPCSKCGGSGQAADDDPARYRAKVQALTSTEAASLIREAAEACLATAKECQESVEVNDRELVDMYTEDASNLREVARLCEAGDFSESLEYRSNMDTAAREWIPDLAYDFMYEKV